jgi:cyclopropane fatty-acyl-phospholipid synthase-like methyltransferase
MQRLDQGIHVLDLGCGSGRALNLMAARFPLSHFTGYDLSRDAIAIAGQEARELGLTNVGFEARDLSDFDVSAAPEAFDFVTTFDAVHDQAKPRRLLAGIYRTLRPGGVYLMQDIHASSEQGKNADHPLGTLLYTISCMHCMTVSLAQGGDGLGAMWGRELATELLRDAGFRQVAIHRLDHDVQNDYYVIRK